MLKGLVCYFFRWFYRFQFGNFKKAKLRPFPSNIFLEVTNACNLKCIMCPSKDMRRERGFMEFGLFKKAIDECSQYGKITINLHMFGEPLLHPELAEMIRYIKGKGNIKVAFSTNATLLNESISKGLIESGLDGIHFSIDGATKETAEKVRPGSNFDQVVKNISDFLEMKRQLNSKNPVVEIQIIEMEETKEEIKEFLKFWKPVASGTNTILDVKKYDAWAGLVRRRIVPVGIECRVPCVRTRYQLGVHWNGDVIPCCADAQGVLKMGSLKNSSLAEIWQSKKMEDFRQIHIDEEFHKIPLCDRCDATRYWVSSNFAKRALKHKFLHYLGIKTEYLEVERR